MRLGVVALVAFVLASVTWSVTLKNRLLVRSSPSTELKIGEIFQDVTLRSIDGKSLNLSTVMQGRTLVLINFWATWCAPCRVEMPLLEKVYDQNRNSGFIIIGVSEDKERNRLVQYLKTKPVVFPVLWDADGALAGQLKISSLPTSILVDGQRKILEVIQGVDANLEARIQRHLERERRIDP